MQSVQKKKTAAEVAKRNIVGEQRSESSVEDAVRMVRISLFAVMAKMDMVEGQMSSRKNEDHSYQFFFLQQFCTN
jgi:hypothetical protein